MCFRESDDSRLSTVESVLKIENINRNDHHDRSFVCKVKQNDIEVDSKTTNSKVNVLYAPEQPSIPSSTEFVERSTASISCEGKGFSLKFSDDATCRYITRRLTLILSVLF